MRITGEWHEARYGDGNKEHLMRPGTLHTLLGLIAVTSLYGCVASRAPVTPVSDEVYHVRTTGARYETQADTNMKALSAANEYCGTQGKQLMFRQSVETAEHAWSPKAEDLTFVCVDAQDPSYMNAANRRDTAVIAKQ